MVGQKQDNDYGFGRNLKLLFSPYRISHLTQHFKSKQGKKESLIKEMVY